jgi:hypothetical protein
MSTDPSFDSVSLLIVLGDEAVKDLIEAVREQMSILFKICESIAMLDMVLNTLALIFRKPATYTPHRLRPLRRLLRAKTMASLLPALTNPR